MFNDLMFQRYCGVPGPCLSFHAIDLPIPANVIFTHKNVACSMFLCAMEEYKRQFVLNLLAYAVQRDISPADLCRLSGLDFLALKNGSAGPLTEKQVNDLWLNAVHLTKDPAFGLHFGESVQLSALGVVGQIIQSSKTVGEALTHAAQAIHLITDIFSMQVTRKNKAVTLKFLLAAQKEINAVVFQQWLEFFMVFSIHELDGLILMKIRPLRAKFPMNKETDPLEYERVLRCKPQHKPNDCLLEFDDRFWDEPILTANYELQRLMLEKVGQKTMMTTNAISLSERIINYLTANAYLGIASLEEIAANFNSSPRTLQRKLQEEGVSFQQLADSVRKSIAMHYLQSGNYPVKEVSYILGYNELSAFTRAFKRWTGKTPLDFQKK
jgi:AraC-like DNA-binding protein